jgi:hypothetical protein
MRTRRESGRASDLGLGTILWAAAIAVPPPAVFFARRAGASWTVAVAFGALGGLAVCLSSRQWTTETRRPRSDGPSSSG